MKIKLEPERFKKLLEAGMIMRGKAMIDPVIIKFNKDEALIADLYSDVIGVNINLSKKFFLEYDAKEEIVSIPSIVLERLGWGFKDKSIDIETKENKVFVKGKHDSYDTEIEDLEPKSFPFPLKETDNGIIPEKLDFKSAVKIDAKNLKLPPGKEYQFELKGKTLTVKIPGSGNFVRKMECEVIGDEDIKMTLDSDYYHSIAENLEGEVTLVLNKDIVVFAEKHKDYTKTYLLSTMVEE